MSSPYIRCATPRPPEYLGQPSHNPRQFMVSVRPVLTIFRVSSVALLLGLSALTPACKKVEGATAAPQRPPSPVRVASAVERDVPVYLEQIGRSTAPQGGPVQAPFARTI